MDFLLKIVLLDSSIDIDVSDGYIFIVLFLNILLQRTEHNFCYL